DRLGWFELNQSRVLKIGHFPVVQGPDAPPLSAALGSLQSVTGYESHVQVMQGRLPQRTGPEGVIEVAMSARSAGAAKLKPGYKAETAWHVFAQPDRLTRSNYKNAHDDIKGLFSDFEPYGGYAINSLVSVLEGFAKTVTYQQVPLTILLLQISAVALFYVLL